MNSNRKNIIAYVDGSMTPEEKIPFEKELEENQELRKELQDIKRFAEQMKNDAGPAVDESYFINILPEFYSRHLRKKRFLLRRLAYSLTAAAAVLVILFIIFKPADVSYYNDIKDLGANLNEKELNETLSQYENPYSLNDLMNSATSKTDSIVNNMVKDELNLTSGTGERLVAEQYVNTDDLLNSLSDNEADELYSQLINADIINGAKQ